MAERDDLLLRNPESHDRDALILLNQMCRSPIHNDVPCPRIPRLHVSLQPVPRSHRSHQNSLSLPKTSRLHEIRGDLNTSLVVNISLLNDGSVKLRFQLNALHGVHETRNPRRGQAVKNSEVEKSRKILTLSNHTMKILIPIIITFTGLLSLAQEATPAIPPLVAKKALEWMQNSDPSKRAAAYRTFQLYGDEGGAIYRRTLEKARELHGKKLSDLLENERSNPFYDLPELAKKLTTERARIYALIKTDYKKQADKIAMLRREVESLAKINEDARKIIKKDPETLDKSITVIATALAEVTREVNLIDEVEFDREKLDLDAALEEVFEGKVYLENRKVIAQLRKEVSDLAAARTDNDACDWANGSQKTFTHHLNEFRSLFALTPLRLEEKLSDAAVGHSKDMASMGFFAHQSPIPEKKSPADRARLAGFKHRWSGENIFMGSTSPVAAYNAWFGSDGHRFIMFAKGPNLIGIGPHGRHWTMMTGRK